VVDLKELGFDAGAKPHHIAVEPDGAHWYVSLISAGRVLKFTRDNELVGQAEFEVPGLLELDPSSDHLFVGRSMAAVNPPQRIGMIDTNTMETEELEVFIPRPHALAVAPNGKFVYSASLAENRMTVINIETGDTEFHDLDGPTHTLVDLQISPDGKTMISGGQLTSKFFFFDSEDQAGVPIQKIIDVDAAPWHPVFNREGTRAYFANKMADKVTILNMETREVEAVIEGNGLAQPHGTALSSDGRYLYVSNQNMNMAYTSADGSNPGTVVVIDTQSAEIVKVLEVGTLPSGAGGRPTW
jgi:DNA-binding beta-propeller fold protein YncE